MLEFDVLDMKLLKKFLYRWVRRVNLRKRAKVWGDLEETELCLPKESIELLASQDDIPPFWKEVLLSISDANTTFLFHQTVVTNAFLIQLRELHPNASRHEISLIMSELIDRSVVETRKADLEQQLRHS